MDIEYKLEVKTMNHLLLLEINNRVKIALGLVKKGSKVRKVDLEILKIDKSSLENSKRDFGHGLIMANNLISKIDYILKSQETE